MKIGYASIKASGEEPKPQADALKKAGCRKIFVEETERSGETGNRLKEAIEACGAGDALVVSRLRSLGASLKNVIETVDLLHGKGAAFVSLEEGIDTAQAGGEAVMRVFEALACLQKETSRERTIAGMATARARGRSGGRPRAVGEKTLAKAKSMRHDSDLSVAEICKKLKISRSTFYRYLKA